MQTEWERKVPPGTPLVIHGAGNLCRQLFERFPQGPPKHPILAVCDNDRNKIIGNQMKMSPDAAFHFFDNRPIYVILVHLGAEDVRGQLIGLGVDPARIVHWWTMWQHFSDLKLPEWANAQAPPAGWLDVWSDDASREVIQNAYNFFKRYSDRTAEYKPQAAYSLPESIYFDPTVYRPRANDILFDGGAFTGDTLDAYSKWVNRDKTCTAIAVEASPENFRDLEFHWARVPAVRLVHAALVGDPYLKTVDFSGHGVSAKIAAGGQPVPATTIDELCQFSGVDIIKLDIEGNELDALHGGIATIQKFRPVIACCLYHRPRDLWEIPQFLASVCRNHSYLRFAKCHDDVGFETVAYFVPAERACHVS